MEHGRRPVARTSFDESRDYDWDVRTFPVFDERETDFPNFVLNTGRSNSIGYGVAAHSSAPEDKPNEQIFGWNPGALSWEKADLFTESLGLFVGPATWLRSKCSTCKRRFPSPTAVKTCSQCLLKQRSKAKVRREQVASAEKPEIHTSKFCSSCKRHLDTSAFISEYKTCERCRSRKVLARAAVREISPTRSALRNVLMGL